jgi:hypothetical protein
VYVQIAQAPGWHAEQEGRRVPISADALGMLYVEPRSTGNIQVRVVYDGGAEAVWARVLQSIGILAIAAVWFTGSGWRRHDP